MTYIIEKRFSQARFQRLTSARFIERSGVSAFAKTGIGSVKQFRTPNVMI